MSRQILLGINSPMTESGAELRDGNACAITLDSGRIVSVVAIQEERLSGRRYDGGIVNAAQYCLKHSGPADAGLRVAFSSALDKAWTKQAAHEFLVEQLKIQPKRVEVVDHHESHAWEAFATSPFREAVVVVIDSMGNELGEGAVPGWQTHSYYIGRRSDRGVIGFELLYRECTESPGYGQLFRSVTRYLGFPGYHHASKVMAIAGIGKGEGRNALPHPHWFRSGRLEMTVDLDPDDVFAPLQQWVETAGGKPHPPRCEDWYCKDDYRLNGRSSLRWMDKEIAVAVQSGYEAFLLERVASLVETTGISNVCIGGGCALNCVANARLLQQGVAKKVYVGSAPGDCGQGLGNALKLLNAVSPAETAHVSPPFLGVTYSQAQVLRACRECQVEPAQIGNVASKVAGELASGRIVAVAAGGSEYGPRALGNRSILAAPDQSLLSTLQRIKCREDYQPFAISTLSSLSSRLFRVAPESPYMSFAPIMDGADSDTMASVIHDDLTCRVQTVDRHRNPLLHDILMEFHALTGIPGIVNTSLNLRGEPIAENPRLVLKLWERAQEIDGVVLGDAYLTRRDRP